MPSMKTKSKPSVASAIRLEASIFVKLRELMQARGGREWLEKIILREHKKEFDIKERSLP